tara:strand:+ start:3624 stop:3881 length:258 start_codon:yes stop_codon:yes gene_type:complete
MDDLHLFNALKFGSDIAAPEPSRLFGFHVAHVMTFMTGLFSARGFVFAASHFAIFTLFAAAALLLGSWRLCGKSSTGQGQRQSAN